MDFQLSNEYKAPATKAVKLQVGFDFGEVPALGVTGPDCFQCDRYPDIKRCPFVQQGASGCPEITF